MGTESLLKFEPEELVFSFELNKQLSSSIILESKSNNPIAYKLYTTNPSKYVVRPRIGVLLPGSACEITVIMRAERVAPRNMRCKDRFMIKSAVARPGATTEDAREMFHETAHDFRNDILRVVYISPPPEVQSPASDAPTDFSFGESEIENADPDVSEVNDSGVEPHDDVAQVNDSDIEPDEDAAQTSTEKLLDIHPEEIQFPPELNKEVSCSLKLSNATENYVAFMVKTASDEYRVHPNIGIILPQSACDITVRMLAQSEVHLDTQREDKFLIQSLVVIPTTTIEQINPEMVVIYICYLSKAPCSRINDLLLPFRHCQFDKGWTSVQEREVQVVHILNQENSDNNVAELVMKAIVSCLLGLLSWYIMRKTLSLIGSLVMVLIMLMMKMVKKLVSDSVEDWVVKTLIYILMHFILRRKENVHM